MAQVSKLETCEKGGKTRETKTGKTCGRILQICLQVLRTVVCPSLSSKTCGQNLQNLPGNRRNPKVSVDAGARIHAPLQKTTGKAAQNRGSRRRSGGEHDARAADRVWDATGRADGQADGDDAQPRRRGVSPSGAHGHFAAMVVSSNRTPAAATCRAGVVLDPRCHA